MAALLAVKDGGTVIFFSMATSFTGAALGAEGVGKDATLLIGNGYVPGHADLTLGPAAPPPQAARPLRVRATRGERRVRASCARCGGAVAKRQTRRT